MKKRIWELDALRGLCILGVVIVHLIYDLVDLYGIIQWDYPSWFAFIKDWGGIIFILLSGICVTLGSHSVRRGLIVFGCGMICTAVTAGMLWLGMAGESIIIRFGVLHCLGLCMILWAVFKKLPTWFLVILSAVIVALGFWFQGIRVEATWLFPLGLTAPGFSSSDYFPLFPNLGYFLLGSVLGRVLYRRRQTLLPKVNPQAPVLRFLCFCGRQSLLIYLLHQPVLSGLCMLLSLF